MTTHKISVSFDDATLAALHRGARGEHRSVSNYLAALVLRAEGERELEERSNNPFDRNPEPETLRLRAAMRKGVSDV